MSAMQSDDDDCKSETYAFDDAPDDAADAADDDADDTPPPRVPPAGVGNVNDKERFKLIRSIGSGAFGDVHEAVCQLTDAKVAVKLAKLSGVPGNERDDGVSIPKALLRELWCLQELRGSPHVTQYVAHFPRGACLAIVLEYSRRADVSPVNRGDAATWIYLCGESPAVAPTWVSLR